jgi:phospho-N-acetylmuramoyl-pentapeptide-transferase
MLYLLLYPLKSLFGPFNLFRYITFRAAYAGLLSLIICLAIGPWLIKKLKKMAVGQNIRSEVPERHLTKAGTPSMGGILIILSVVLTSLLFADLKNLYIILALFVIVAFGCLGYIDDYVKIRLNKPRGLRKRTKLIFQVLISLVVAIILYYFPQDKNIATLTNIPFFKNFIVDFKIFYIPFAVCIMIATSNAVNFADGLDGLAPGLLGITCLSYAVLSYISGHMKIAEYLNLLHVPSAGEMAVICTAILGACLGFLWFNTYPAQVFMGDTGSLALGAIIGYAAIISKHELLLLFVGGVFWIEIISVVVQVIYYHFTHGRRLFRMAPLHHHFELCGLPEPKITVRFWILGIIFALLAISTLKIR